MTDIAEVISDCWRTAQDHGFHGVQRTFGDTCTLITSEISEAYEAFREEGKITAFTDYAHGSPGKPEGAVVELLDAVIRIFDTCVEEAGLAPTQVAFWLAEKMAYNTTRPHMHGKVI